MLRGLVFSLLLQALSASAAALEGRVVYVSDRFAALAEQRTDSKELSYEMLWQGESDLGH